MQHYMLGIIAFFGLRPKPEYPVIPSVLHRRQNHLESTSNIYKTFFITCIILLLRQPLLHINIFLFIMLAREFSGPLSMSFGPSYSVRARALYRASGWPFQQ
jgi:hypothetical protein